MKRFQELLTKDLGWKLLSVAIAAIMWFMVINITQPVDTRSYTRPIILQNQEVLTNRGLTIGNAEELKNARVSVKVKAQRTALDSLTQAPDRIQVTVDLSELAYAVSGDTVALPVNVSMQSGITGYDIVNKTPSVIEVKVETLAFKELPVQIMLSSEVPNSIYLSEPTLSAETVIVTGPASAIRQVASVRGYINGETLKDAPTQQVKLAAYAANDEQVRGVSASPEEITVSYALLDAKRVPIQVDITGTPAAGYQVGSSNCTPKFAEVTGAPEDLEKLVYLQVDSIDVSNATESVSKSYALKEYLPEGVSLRADSNAHAQIVVEILPQTGKEITIDTSQLTMLGQEAGKQYTLGQLRLTVSGEKSLLDGLKAEDLHGTVNVSGLSEGEHSVIVHVDLPDELSANPAYIDVKISGDTEPTENE